MSRATADVAVGQETLTERMARGGLSLVEALRYATEIATILRDLHLHGLAYGAVSSQLIVLIESGATFRNTGGLTRLGESRLDVTAFGAFLDEMLCRATGGPDDLRAGLASLAGRCRKPVLDMQQALIGLRLLALKARHVACETRRPLAQPRPQRKETLGVYLHTALQWRPLTALAAFALFSK